MDNWDSLSASGSNRIISSGSQNNCRTETSNHPNKTEYALGSQSHWNLEVELPLFLLEQTLMLCFTRPWKRTNTL